MKKLKKILILTKVGLLFIIILSLAIITDCKDPNEYKPDSLLPPPPPPLLLSPPDSFVHMPLGYNRLSISWESIEDAELYEINFVGETTKTWTTVLDKNQLIQNWFLVRDRFTWKARAYSSKWDYYTNWSTPRHFEVRDTFPSPTLLYPPHETTFVFDYLPANIYCLWDTIHGAQYYEIKVYYYNSLIYERRLTNNHDLIMVDTTGKYSWQVQAGSNLWEFNTGWAGWNFHVVKNQKLK